MVPTPGPKCMPLIGLVRTDIEKFQGGTVSFLGSGKVHGGSRNYPLVLAAIDQLVLWPFVGRVFPIVCISEIADLLTMNEKHTIGSRSDLCKRRNAHRCKQSFPSREDHR